MQNKTNYIFGDSWAYSYRQTQPQTPTADSQSFCGEDLANLISQRTDRHVFNLAERGANLHTIAEKIIKARGLFQPHDRIIVLQTDPFRSLFVQWYNRNMIVGADITIDTPMTLLDVCEDKLLTMFYRKLSVLQKSLNVEIILHGGMSKVCTRIASSLGLKHTPLSSSEIIAQHIGCDFTDDYFMEVGYTLANHEYLLQNYPNYIREQDISSILAGTENKYKFWATYPEYFTHNHTTKLGSSVVADYLVDYLKI